MAIGQGGIDYGKADKKRKKKIEKNESRIRQDYDYVQSEIDRAQNVIKERQERGLDTSAQDKYLGKLKGQLDTNPTFMRRSYKDETQDRIQSEVQNEIEKRKRSIANDMQEQRQANRSAIEGNENFLEEQIGNYQQQQGQANREATQLQNRRGGFYSGGLDYQRGQIARATTNAIEDTSREVAQRNASLREQNAMISRQASEAIRELESQAPDLVRSRVMDAMQRWDQKQMQEAQLTGQYMGQQTLQGQQLDMQRDQQQFEQDFAIDQFEYQQARDQIQDERWKMQFDEDVRRFGLQHALDRQVQMGQLSQGWSRINQANRRLQYQQQQDAIRNSQWQQEFNLRQDQMQQAEEEEREQESMQNLQQRNEAMQAQRQQQQQQLNADAYNEFLMDVNRIQDMNEGQALIQAYKQQGVSTEVITEMIQTLNDRFGY